MCPRAGIGLLTVCLRDRQTVRRRGPTRTLKKGVETMASMPAQVNKLRHVTNIASRVRILGESDHYSRADRDCPSLGTTPSIDRLCSPPRGPLWSSPTSLGETRTYPSPRLEPPPGAIRPRNPKAPAAPRSGLDQPAGRGRDATACSPNPNRQCLNVVDRFRPTARQ